MSMSGVRPRPAADLGRDGTTISRATGSVAAVSVGSAIAAGFADAAPTGRPLPDLLIRATGIGLVTLLAARAVGWALVIAAAAAIAIALDPLVLGAALAGLVAVAIAHRVRHDATTRAVGAGLIVNALIRAELDGPFGVSAAITSLVVLAVAASGLRRASRPLRRLVLGGAMAAVAYVAVAGAGTGYAVYSARHELSGGVRDAEKGVAALEQGDVADALDWFRQAADRMSTAHDRLDRAWTSPAAIVPVLAQHRDAVVEMSRVGASGAAVVVEALEAIDLEVLRVHDGQIDLDAIAALEGPLGDVRAALEELSAATAAAQSPWLVGRAQYELEDFEASTSEHVESLDSAMRAIAEAPAMLGGDGARRYLLLFTSPAESRPLGGVVVTYAELIADDGRLSLETTGQASDLDEVIAATSASGSPPAALADALASAELGHTSPFSNLTTIQHFPTTANSAADLYERATGRPVDGVILADPMVFQELLHFVGPVRLATYGADIDAYNAFGFLLHDQYMLRDDEPRLGDATEDATIATFDAIFQGALPDPIKLSNALGWLVDDRRLLFWSAHPDEQALLEWVDATGALPSVGDSAGWAVIVSNTSGRRLDTFLGRRASIETSTDDGGITDTTVGIELTNGAPSDGAPSAIIGGGGDPPRGTTRLQVSIYSPLDLVDATLDGESIEMTQREDMSWQVYSVSVEIPAGGDVTIELRLRGVVERPDDLVTWVQPLAGPLELAS